MDDPNRGMNEYPTAWQQKVMWGALAALSVAAIGAIAVGLIWLFSNVIGFLQPILIPFAISGVMAYLLEPVVSKIVSWGTSRQRAVISVFALVTIGFAGVMVWIIPAIWMQMSNLVQKVPAYRDRIEEKIKQFNDWVHTEEQKFGVRVLPPIVKEFPNPFAGADEHPATTETTLGKPNPAPVVGAAAQANPQPVTANAPGIGTPAAGDSIVPTGWDLQSFLKGDWLRNALPVIARNAWNFITNSVGGFLGVFGFLISMVIVPIYLYYFLIEAKNIAESWGDYLPLRASAFKDEVVSALNEINGYLIAFFRGQLLVSLINGSITGIGLVLVGLDFGLLIGLTLCLLGLIPYLGIILCWVPAVIIASVQGSPWFLHGAQWWVFPVIVTGIFFAVNQLDGLVVTPRIVGESVGLHPMTVIASVFVWSLLLGGLLGAILAVPLTATIKVLLRRYIWQRRIFAEPGGDMTEETFAVQQAQETDGRLESVSSK